MHENSTAAELLRDWQNAHGPVANGETMATQVLALSLPCSHAVLVSHRAWRAYALPIIPRSDWRRTGFALVRPLVAGVAGAAAAEAALLEGGPPVLTLEHALRLSDCLRLWAPAIYERFGRGGADELRYHVGWLEAFAKTAQGTSDAQFSRAYSMENLIAAVCLSGLLSSSATCRSAVKASLAVIFPSAVAQHFEAEVDRPHAVPARSTVLRHRLTLTLAWYASMQPVHREMLSSGGLLRFESVDSSPQGGHDYVMRWTVTIAAQFADEAFDLAQALCRTQLGPGAGPPGFVAGDAMTRLSEIIRRHVGCLTSVGSGRSGLRYKFACLCHSTRMETASWSDAVQVMNSICSFTTDFGAESMLPSLTDVRLGSAFPWLDETFDFEGQSAALWKAMEPSDAELRVQLQNALHVPGCLHIFHNMTKDIIGSLEHFEEWVGQLQAVAKVCSKPWSKRRLLATCFSSTETMPFRPQIEGFSCHVHPGRWGSMAHAIRELLKVERALRSGWDLSLLLYNQREGRRAGRDPDEEADNSAHMTDEAVRSDFFWVYGGMVDALAEVVTVLMHWSEGCACHFGQAHAR